jgi:hypothetical protein
MFHPTPHYSAEELLALYWKLRGVPLAADGPKTSATDELTAVSVGCKVDPSSNGSKDEA